MSRSSQQHGQGLEDILAIAHALYWTKYHAWVAHNGISGTWHARRGGEPTFAPASNKAAPDYYGCIVGKFIAFDAKASDNKTLWRLKPQSGHQLDALRDLQHAGAVVWFAVECRPAQTLFLLPIKPTSWPMLDFTSPGVDGALTVPWDDHFGYDWLTHAIQAGWLRWTGS